MQSVANNASEKRMKLSAQQNTSNPTDKRLLSDLDPLLLIDFPSPPIFLYEHCSSRSVSVRLAAA